MVEFIMRISIAIAFAGLTIAIIGTCMFLICLFIDYIMTGVL